MDIHTENIINNKVKYFNSYAYYFIESGYISNNCFDKYIFGFCKKTFLDIQIGTAVYIEVESLNSINISSYYNERLTEKELEELAEKYKCNFILFPTDGIFKSKKYNANLCLTEI